MPFYNGSTATLNGQAGAGPAANTADFLTRLRAFLAANGWTATSVVNIGSGQANLVFSSTGLGGDENINIRVQTGNVNNSLLPLNTPVVANRVRFTVSPFFDTASQIVYNEAGSSATACQIPTDDSNPFNFWIFSDGPPATAIWVVTQTSGTYDSLFAGRLVRQIFGQTARVAQGITVTSPGTAQVTTVNLDRPRPASWVQGKVLFVQSQSTQDTTGNGAGISAQIVPVEMATVQALSGLTTNQVSLKVSRNYAAGALIAQDVLPLGVVKDPIGTGDALAMTYDNGGGQNALAYTGPASQVCNLGVPCLVPPGGDIDSLLSAQGPDAYQGDQIMLPLFSYSTSGARKFAMRHQLPSFGRIAPTNNPLDELVLASGDRWVAFTTGGARVAIGKEN